MTLRLFALFLAFVTVFMVNCNKVSPPQRSAALTVTFDGQEVHRRNTGWISSQQLEKAVQNPGKKIFIFGADWCEACRFLRRALNQADLTQEIHWINVDEPWAAKLITVMGIRSIPFMLATDEKGNNLAQRVGPGKITMYLLLN